MAAIAGQEERGKPLLTQHEVSTTVGAKEVKSNKKITNWNQVTMEDPEIAKYFEDE